MRTQTSKIERGFSPVIFFLWFIVMGFSLLLSLIDLRFHRSHFEEDLFQQAQILSDCLRDEDIRRMKDQHMVLDEENEPEWGQKLTRYQNDLKRAYPEASLKFLYMCEGEHLEILDPSDHAQNLPHPQLSQWESAILEKNYGALRLENSLSVISPVYATTVDCEHMAVCIYFENAPTGSGNTTDPMIAGLIFILGYTGIILVSLVLQSLVKSKPENMGSWQAIISATSVFLVGFLFSAQFSHLATQIERRLRVRAFENVAASMTSRLSERLVEIEHQNLMQLVAFIEASEAVTSAEFHRYTRDFQTSSSARIWYWIPMPGEGQKPVVAYNSKSNLLNETLEAVFSDESKLIFKTLQAGGEKSHSTASDIHVCEIHKDPSIFVAHPVWKNNDLKGWAGCSLSIGRLLEESLHQGSLNPDTVLLEFVEMKASEESPDDRIHANSFTRPVFMFGRAYLIHATPTPLFWNLYPLRLNLWVWFFGGLISLIVSIMVYQNLQRHQLLEYRVQDRTKSLDQLLHKHLNITNNLPLGLALCVDDEICEMNPKMQTWFKNQEELCTQLTPLVKEHLNQGKKFKEQVQLQTQFGKRQMKCTILQIPEGVNQKQLLILLEDWTDQLRSEQALTEKKIELERLFNSSTDLMCISTLDGTFLNLNPQWEQTLGHPVSELTGQKWTHFVHESDCEQAGKILERICDGASTQNFTLRFEHRRGEEVWLEWKATREGNLIHANVRDITARINAEEKNRSMREHVARAQKMESIGRLAGGIAHDFNNSLQVIIGNAQLVLSNQAIPESQKNQLKDILKAADRSAQLTRQLLGFAMKQHVQADPTNLNHKLHDMEPMFNTILGDLIQLEWHLSPELSRVKMDSGQLEQICVSLLENARDAMPRGGKVWITTENRNYCDTLPDDLVIDVPPGQYVCFSIRDTGNGIDVDLLGTVFEPFTTTQDPSRGSGLGLATVYGILQQNHGTVRVESEPNQGTLMEILLPRLGEVHDPGPPPPLDNHSPGKILVVDDNPQILQLANLVLQELHYRVISHTSPVKALTELEKDPEIALLLTDVLMPEMTGQELYKKALAIRPDLKCIFMSGYSSDVVDATYLREGICTFLIKPFSLDGVKDAVGELLQPPG